MTEARLLDPGEALVRALERLRAALPDRRVPTTVPRREMLEMAAHDVLRALVSTRRAMRNLELDCLTALDAAAHELGCERLRSFGCAGERR